MGTRDRCFVWSRPNGQHHFRAAANRNFDPSRESLVRCHRICIDGIGESIRRSNPQHPRSLDPVPSMGRKLLKCGLLLPIGPVVAA
jgi:hypothetical protein